MCNACSVNEMDCKCCAELVIQKKVMRITKIGKKPILGDPEEFGYTEEQWKALSRSTRWRLRNPDKMKAAVAKWARDNPEHRDRLTRKYRLSVYGLTPDEYDRLLNSQQNRCAICLTDTPTGRWKVFAVDHDHNTGLVRGLLCNECNRGIGLLKDSSDLLKSAYEYINRHDKKTNKEKSSSVKDNDG